MLLTLAALASLALAQDTDTTLAVQPGTRLDVNNFGGEIAIRTWNQNRVRVQATHSSRDRVEISTGSSTIGVRAESRRGVPQSVDFAITVPQWMDVALSGTYTDITVEGGTGSITAETVQGEITARGGGGHVSLKSVEGAVSLEAARGRVEASSVNESVTLTGVSGDVTVETVNGDITLTRVDAASVDASTVNGDIDYDGTIRDNGTYHFATHNGDVTVTMPERASASVTVSTFSGDFEACQPVQLQHSTKHRFTFTIGTGSARLELESFGGDIRLRCPGEPGRPRDKDRDRNRDHDRDRDDNQTREN